MLTDTKRHTPIFNLYYADTSLGRVEFDYAVQKKTSVSVFMTSRQYSLRVSLLILTRHFRRWRYEVRYCSLPQSSLEGPSTLVVVGMVIPDTFFPPYGRDPFSIHILLFVLPTPALEWIRGFLMSDISFLLLHLVSQMQYARCTSQFSFHPATNIRMWDPSYLTTSPDTPVCSTTTVGTVQLVFFWQCLVAFRPP